MHKGMPSPIMSIVTNQTRFIIFALKLEFMLESVYNMFDLFGHYNIKPLLGDLRWVLEEKC